MSTLRHRYIHSLMPLNLFFLLLNCDPTDPQTMKRLITQYQEESKQIKPTSTIAKQPIKGQKTIYSEQDKVCPSYNQLRDIWETKPSQSWLITIHRDASKQPLSTEQFNQREIPHSKCFERWLLSKDHDREVSMMVRTCQLPTLSSYPPLTQGAGSLCVSDTSQVWLGSLHHTTQKLLLEQSPSDFATMSVPLQGTAWYLKGDRDSRSCAQRLHEFLSTPSTHRLQRDNHSVKGSCFAIRRPIQPSPYIFDWQKKTVVDQAHLKTEIHIQAFTRDVDFAFLLQLHELAPSSSSDR